MDRTKPFDIPKVLVWKAFQLVKANRGAAGVDGESIAEFELNLSKNLYKLWNRMSSGTYFPLPVKGVEIPKKQGGVRILGVPTVGDRICQMMVKLVFEPMIEPYFLSDSYGYRPNKSAIDAVAVTRERCWQYDFVLEYDIRALFDKIDHELLMKAVRKHMDNKWVILYIERGLTASMQMPDGTMVTRTCGTSQGGVASPILANLFLHYAFDVWMAKYHKDKPWARYADDGIVHCRTEAQAQALLVELKHRFAECGLELHPDKTKIVYCKTSKGYDKDYPNTKFKFLGYEFRRRMVRSKSEHMFLGFTPAICDDAKKDIVAKIRKLGVRNRTELSIEDISRWMNPLLRGWINYYGKFTKSALYPTLQKFDRMLVAWAMSKYKNLRRKKVKACLFIKAIAQKRPYLFAHWQWSNIRGFV